ncbi:MAG: hypothetical protein O6944_06510 [Gammaproteobacteria bacterium]|nr:hypothetical protein [Gammaproteobacteria bacterium]
MNPKKNKSEVALSGESRSESKISGRNNVARTTVTAPNQRRKMRWKAGTIGNLGQGIGPTDSRITVSLVAKLRRRNGFKVADAYAAVAWLAIRTFDEFLQFVSRSVLTGCAQILLFVYGIALTARFAQSSLRFLAAVPSPKLYRGSV